MLPWLSALGLDAFLYAPKSDPWLRRRWRDRWPQSHIAMLQELAAKAKTSRLELHIGLSPFALYRSYDAPARSALRSVLLRLEDLDVRGVALLFDDMPGDMDSLAERQAEILCDAHAWLDQPCLRFCPTYYSDDPVLDRVFGVRPVDYLQTLARILPADVIPFWTGPQVCSQAVPASHLNEISQVFGRPIALWDNYPVNDSKLRSEHLYVAPLLARTPCAALDSHWCNAMNQAALSLPALKSLAALHGRSGPAGADALAQAGITHDLLAACSPLAERGRTDLDRHEKAALAALSDADTAAAEELRDWLAGRYRFDPACLTD